MASDQRQITISMADKRRAVGGSPVPRAPPRQTNEADFLSQAGVRNMLREAVLKLLEARPEDPATFLADYFGKLGLGATDAVAAGDRGQKLLGHQRLGRALWYLRLAHHSQRCWKLAHGAGQAIERTAFNNNLSIAYDCLSAGGRKKRLGLNGKVYSEVLTNIFQEGSIPNDISSALLKKIQCRDHEAVPFDVFRYGVLTSFVLLEYMSKADNLFDVLNADGLSEQRVYQSVLDTLEEALVASDLYVPASYLEAGSKLGPDCLAIAMDQALLGRNPRVPITRTEFLNEAFSLFLGKVKAIQ